MGLVLQNKKGENIIMAMSNALATRQAALYSNFIYEHILETYRMHLDEFREETKDREDHHFIV